MKQKKTDIARVFAYFALGVLMVLAVAMVCMVVEPLLEKWMAYHGFDTFYAHLLEGCTDFLIVVVATCAIFAHTTSPSRKENRKISTWLLTISGTLLVLTLYHVISFHNKRSPLWEYTFIIMFALNSFFAAIDLIPTSFRKRQEKMEVQKKIEESEKRFKNRYELVCTMATGLSLMFLTAFLLREAQVNYKMVETVFDLLILALTTYCICCYYAGSRRPTAFISAFIILLSMFILYYLPEYTMLGIMLFGMAIAANFLAPAIILLKDTKKEMMKSLKKKWVINHNIIDLVTPGRFCNFYKT